MTNFEFFLGVMALTGCLGAIGAGIQLRRAINAERGKKRAEFQITLFTTVATGALFSANVIANSLLPPSPALSIFMTLWSLVFLGVVLNELRIIVFRARHANNQPSPADSGT
jgi:hypothetical protein